MNTVLLLPYVGNQFSLLLIIGIQTKFIHVTLSYVSVHIEEKDLCLSYK